MSDETAAASPSLLASRLIRVAAVLSGLAGLVLVGVLRCPFAMVFRIPCPGCGMTRATLRLLELDLEGALRFHPLVLVGLPLVAAVFGVNSIVFVQTGRWGYVEGRMSKPVTALFTVLAVITFGVWIARFFGAFGGPVPV